MTLVSAQENIDETPAGQLMHGILAAFNEYRSNADGADIRYKMGTESQERGNCQPRQSRLPQRARQGRGARESGTVAIDPERAPLIRLAFELAATGDYTMARLADDARLIVGSRTRPGRRAAGPISAKYLATFLRDSLLRRSNRLRGRGVPRPP